MRELAKQARQTKANKLPYSCLAAWTPVRSEAAVLKCLDSVISWLFLRVFASSWLR